MAVPYDFGEPEQPGAEAQPRALGRIHVDREAHPSAFEVELDDAARLREALAVADRQNRQRPDLAPAQSADRRVSRLRDEQQVAGPPCRRCPGAAGPSSGWPPMFCPRTVSTSAAAIPSSPTTQTTMGAPGGSAGHSANLAKLKRSAAFTATFEAVAVCAEAEGVSPHAAIAVATASHRIRPRERAKEQRTSESPDQQILDRHLAEIGSAALREARRRDGDEDEQHEAQEPGRSGGSMVHNLMRPGRAVGFTTKHSESPVQSCVLNRTNC